MRSSWCGRSSGSGLSREGPATGRVLLYDPAGNIGGVARTPGKVSFVHPEAGIVAHELGHNFSLRHAPCRVNDVDPRYPWPNGNIGVWGYDSRDGGLPGVTRRPRSDELLSPPVDRRLLLHELPQVPARRRGCAVRGSDRHEIASGVGRSRRGWIAPAGPRVRRRRAAGRAGRGRPVHADGHAP